MTNIRDLSIRHFIRHLTFDIRHSATPASPLPSPPSSALSAAAACGGSRGWSCCRTIRASALAAQMLSAVAEQYPRLRITTSHPAMLRPLSADSAWRLAVVRRAGYTRQPHAVDHAGFRGGAIGGNSAGRCVATFERKANRKISTEKSGTEILRAGNHLSPLATAAARSASPPLMEKPADMTAAAIACMQLPAAAPTTADTTPTINANVATTRNRFRMPFLSFQLASESNRSSEPILPRFPRAPIQARIRADPCSIRGPIPSSIFLSPIFLSNLFVNLRSQI